MVDSTLRQPSDNLFIYFKPELGIYQRPCFIRVYSTLYIIRVQRYVKIQICLFTHAYEF